MRMHDLVRNGKPQTWIKVGNHTDAERRIVGGVAATRITLDVPLSDSFDARYLNPPGTTVVEDPADAARRSRSAASSSCTSSRPPQAISHEQPHFTRAADERRGLLGARRRVRRDDEQRRRRAAGASRCSASPSTARRCTRAARKPAEFAPNGTQVLHRPLRGQRRQRLVRRHRRGRGRARSCC